MPFFNVGNYTEKMRFSILLSPLIVNLNVVEDMSTIRNWPMLLAIAVKNVKVITLFDKMSKFFSLIFLKEKVLPFFRVGLDLLA